MKRWSILLLPLALAGPAHGANFRRGDSNVDARLDLSDAVHTLFYLFSGGVSPTCLDASDSNDSGGVDLSDAVFTLSYLFTGGPDLPAPGIGACGADPTADPLTCEVYNPCGVDPVQLERVGHLLNRAAYGPTFEEVERVLAMGTAAWIEEQLDPELISEAANTELTARVGALTEQLVRTEDRPIVEAGAEWKYMKGTVAPPATWKTVAFDDSTWASGPGGFGYADGDDATVLDDMLGNYLTVFIRHRFTVDDPAAIRDLVLGVNYDDGFVAYLNGVEVARRNVVGAAHNTPASTSHEAGGSQDFDITSRKNLLLAGANVLAIQGHNQAIGSSDFTLDTELLDRVVIPGATTTEIRGIGELKALAQVYAIYSHRQLQAVLGEFWENHLTTDYDKVVEYLDALRNSDASDAMSTAQARKEAARLEHHEFEFFRENALGNFGDLLRYSATNPTMLIYLDNVLNVRGNANENYAREILELHAFGADNGYLQLDIEQLAKCFTGWGVCKVAVENAGNPHAPCGVQVADTALVAAGAAGGNWRYLKGTAEPPPTWKDPGFVDAGWAQGASGFGYGDGDDSTVLSDMLNGYTTLYLRKTFNVANPAALKNLILSIDVDDGFVAYLNGVEVARYYAPGAAGTPVPFDAVATLTHEAGVPFEYNLNSRRGVLVAGQNLLAIQVLNGSAGSSDLTMIPAFTDREVLPGSIENGDPNAVFTFHFFQNLHNSTEAKTLFRGTPYQLNIPAGRAGTLGIKDAEESINRILTHPSTPLFISSKLIQRFVGDQVDFRNPSSGPYSALLARCVAAWNATNPKGDMARVMREILTSNEFWSEGARRSKVKTAFEYISSSVRVLGAETSGAPVLDDLQAMGMEYFTRDEPDGWPETGSDWIDTSTLLNRMVFAQATTEAIRTSSPDLYWDALPIFDAHGLDTAPEIVDFFDSLLFQGTLTSTDRALLLDFLNTDDTYNPLPFSRARTDFGDRVRRALGLMLSMPQWQFQ